MSRTPQAFSYIRFSSPEQMKGESLRRQQEASARWCSENKVTLNASLNLKDLGVSAFQGRNAAIGRLGKFLEAVERGYVKRGDYLIVESLDRISRQKLHEALERFLSIIRSGINIVTLIPQPHVYHAENIDVMDLMLAVIDLSRAGNESEVKSVRIGDAWAKKRERLGSGKVFTRRCPSWIRVENDEYILDEAKSGVVRRIIKMSLEGMGATATCKTLNGEGGPDPLLR